jgi:hypothetical protein
MRKSPRNPKSQNPNTKTPERKKKTKLSKGRICLVLAVLCLSLQIAGCARAGVPITLLDQHDVVEAGQTAWFTFQLDEVEGSDKTLILSVEGLPADWTYDFLPDLTNIASLGTATTTLNIHVPATATPGIFEFTFKVQANDVIFTFLEQVTTYTTQVQIHGIPEYPLGTAIGLTSMIGAVALYRAFPKNRRKKQ